MKINAAPPSVRTASSAAVGQLQVQEQPKESFVKGVLNRVGERFKFAGEHALACGALAAAPQVAAFATTAAISRLIPAYVPYGGMVANLLIGGGVGAAVNSVMHDKFFGAPRTREEQNSKWDATMLGAAMGAWSGFLGMAAMPGATVDWPALGLVGSSMVGVSAGVMAVPNFFGALFKGPKTERG